MNPFKKARTPSLLSATATASQEADARADDAVATIEALTSTIAREQETLTAERIKAQAAARAFEILQEAGF